MLCLDLDAEGVMIIGGDVRVQSTNKTRLLIEAPPNITIVRDEVVRPFVQAIVIREGTAPLRVKARNLHMIRVAYPDAEIYIDGQIEVRKLK